MTTPELRQLGTLNEVDFQRHPVWVACHCLDYDEAWYDETDEETFRPWCGVVPAPCQDEMFLVRTQFTLSDGTSLTGFATPSESVDNFGAIQPCLFVDGRIHSFWGGMIGIPQGQRDDLYAALQKGPDAVFPLSFHSDPGLSTLACSGQLQGFYSSPDLSTVECSQ
ncbi:MAG: hypothetical protein GY930_03805 [bacterium]|nr:hypothetical protein [bacterium]